LLTLGYGELNPKTEVGFTEGNQGKNKKVSRTVRGAQKYSGEEVPTRCSFVLFVSFCE
jgi:hypothetical protein